MSSVILKRSDLSLKASMSNYCPAKQRMPISETSAVIVGLVCGVAFIIVVAVTLDSTGNPFPNMPSQFLSITSYQTPKRT